MITGSAMRKPRIQPGTGSDHADSMMAGRTTLTGTLPRFSAERLLAERLGHGVGVGPAEARSAGPAGLHQLRLHPVLAELLALGGQQRGPGAAELLTSRRHERGELLGLAARGLGIGADPAGTLDLALPVDVGDPERALVDADLGGGAAAVAGHVAGGHGHQVGGHPQVLRGCERCGWGPSG
jgi:hypothetical protein